MVMVATVGCLGPGVMDAAACVVCVCMGLSDARFPKSSVNVALCCLSGVAKESVIGG